MTEKRNNKLHSELHKEDLIGLLAMRTCIPVGDVELFLETLCSTLVHTLQAKEPVKIDGLGVFEVKKKEDGSHAVVFVPEETVKDTLNKPFSFFQPEKLSPHTHFPEINSETMSLQEYLMHFLISPANLVEESSEKEMQKEADKKKDLSQWLKQQQQQASPSEESTDEVDFSGRLQQALVEAKEEWEELSALFAKARQEYQEAEALSETISEKTEDTNLNGNDVKETIDDKGSEQECAPLVENTDAYKEERVPCDDVTAPAEQSEEFHQPTHLVSEQVPLADTTIGHKAAASTSSKRIWIRIILLLLLIVLGSIWMFRGSLQHLFTSNSTSSTPIIEAVLTDPDEEREQLSDSISQEKEEPMHASSLSDTTHVVQDSPSQGVEAGREAASDKLQEVSPITVEVKYGDTFRTLALKYYGHKDFWIYIYQANKDKVPNPNILQIGVRITIPTAASMGIDASSVQSIQKARALADSLSDKR